MPSSDEMDFSQPSPERDRQVTLALTHFFDAYCKDEEVPDVHRHVINPEAFLGWLQGHVVSIDTDEMQTRLKLHPEVFTYIEALSHSPSAVQALAPVWNAIVTATRAMPKRTLASTKLLYMLEWDDGTILPVMIHTPVEIVEGQGFTDGIVCTLLANQVKQLVNMVLTDGLDGLYAKFGDNHGGDGPFVELMKGIVRQVIPGRREDGHPHSEPMKAFMGKYMRLIHACIKPPVPPNVQQLIDERRAKKAAEAKPGELVGGFDAPAG